MARLLYTDHSGRQMAHELDPGRAQTVIGRQSECDVVIADTSVSRRHCRIVPEGSGFAVVDLGSANGTLVNGERVTQRHLVTDDVIRCGVYDVRFVGGVATTAPSLAERYRRARVSAPEGAVRGQTEQLQALAESQARRISQLQAELSRADAERAAVDERGARAEAEARALRQRMGALEDHLRQLLAVLDQRERELETLRSMPAPPPPPPVDLAPPPVAAAADPLAAAALAATNVALKAEIASLQTELAIDDAYDRAARLVPTVDRWQALTTARDEVARLRAASGGAGAADGEGGARRAAAAEAETRRLTEALRTAEDRLARMTTRAESAERRVRDAQTKPPPVGGLGARFGARAGAALGAAKPDGDDGDRAGLLAGLGGLGQTAQSTRPPGRLTDRLSAINTRACEIDARDATLRDLEAEVEAQRRRLERATPDARLLGERLAAFRRAVDVSGLASVQLAELIDLATAVERALDDTD